MAYSFFSLYYSCLILIFSIDLQLFLKFYFVFHFVSLLSIHLAHFFIRIIQHTPKKGVHLNLSGQNTILVVFGMSLRKCFLQLFLFSFLFFKQHQNYVGIVPILFYFIFSTSVSRSFAACFDKFFSFRVRSDLPTHQLYFKHTHQARINEAKITREKNQPLFPHNFLSRLNKYINGNLFMF